MSSPRVKPQPPLKPLKSDRDLYIYENLQRDHAEESRFREAIIREANKQKSADTPASRDQ